MKRALIVVALVGLCVVSAYAQESLVRATIPFTFVAAGTTLPAGTYEFMRVDPYTLEVRNVKEAKGVLVPVLTRLGTNHAVPEPRLTFDVIQGKDVLETLWVGDSDGYLFNVHKEKHTHKTIKVS